MPVQNIVAAKVLSNNHLYVMTLNKLVLHLRPFAWGHQNFDAFLISLVITSFYYD